MPPHPCGNQLGVLNTLMTVSGVLAVILMAGCTAKLESYDGQSDNGNVQSGNGGNSGDGNVDNGDIELSAELSCDSLSFCTTFKINYEPVDMPELLGGNIEDGVYRAVEGTNVLYGLMFENGRFSYLWPDLTVTHGDAETNGDDLYLTSHTYCSRNNSNNPSEGLEETSIYTYALSGGLLYLRGRCGPPNGCPSPTVFKKVESLCESLSSYDCPEGECGCAQFVEESVPPSVSLNAGCNI